MHTTELKVTHTLWNAFLRGAAELTGLRQSLAAFADGHETSFFQRMLFL